ncbi:uncharacterized protein LOC132265843 [Phlebotomus argentipes]|uniref:uncharacterized protein LOC132265843 n=1 Tax=Phlebotomus argentipes TaxID=94469 RepID=UPI0028929EF7|nr:uncharacterized protein LOC132265843 [Phlebotomus argentipes]
MAIFTGNAASPRQLALSSAAPAPQLPLTLSRGFVQVRLYPAILICSNKFALSSRYAIAKYRLQRIIGWKRRYGKFSSLNEILELDDFGEKILQRFCSSIVQDAGQTGKIDVSTVKKSSQILTPKLMEDKRSAIKSCCAVQVGIDSVSWCRLEIQDDETPSLVTHWQFFPLNCKKSHLVDLSSMIEHVNQIIPESDAFVMENPVAKQGSPNVNTTQIAVSVQQSQVIAMMTLILSLRKEDHHTCVFFVKNYVPARLFGTLVGQERTSSLHVVSELVSSRNQSTSVPPKGSITALPGVLANYELADGAEKEYLGRCLMLSVSFLRLCLLKCPVSIAIANRRGK